MSKALEKELLELQAQKDAIEKVVKEKEKELTDKHPHQVGTPVLINNTQYIIRYLFVRYEDDVVTISENYSSNPTWDDKAKEYIRWTPHSIAKVEYLKPLKTKELDRLIELNEMYDFSNVDSRSEADKLSDERDALRKRCGHDWHDLSGIFASRERWNCRKCGWELEEE